MGRRMRRLAAVGKWPAGLGVLLVLLLHLAGVFRPGRIEAGWTRVEGEEPDGGKTARAELCDVPLSYGAVGTIRSRRSYVVASQTSGRIFAVRVREGDAVTAGALLVEIESDLLEAKREQARQARQAARSAERAARDGVAAAEARLARARAERDRIAELFAGNAATPREHETAEADFRGADAAVNAAQAGLAGARAEVARADGLLREVELELAYARVEAPTAGEVVQRRVEPGDLAWPGRPLVVLHDPRDLRLEAGVREGLVRRAVVGAGVRVQVEALDLELDGVVDEVVPMADPRSRTFLVKVSIPYREGLLTGMFGRLQLPLGTRKAVLVPVAAVRRIGQLEQVRVVTEGRAERRFARTGRRYADRVEVLSGLSGGETVVIEEGR